VQRTFGNLELTHTHDQRDIESDDPFDFSICNILPHKFENASHRLVNEPAAGPQSSFHPTIEFSSDDLRSQHPFSSRRSSRPSSELVIQKSSQCSESNSRICACGTSSPRTTRRSTEEFTSSASSLRGIANRLKQILRCRLQSSQSKGDDTDLRRCREQAH
jgi:hypothetical protein